MFDIGALIQQLKEYTSLSKDILDIKNAFIEMSKTDLTQEDIERFYEPLYNNIIKVKTQLNKNENIEQISWDNSLLENLYLPKELEKSKKRLIKLNFLINKTVDTFTTIGNSCQGIVRSSIRASNLQLNENDQVKNELTEVGFKSAYLALGINSYLNNTGLNQFIKQNTILQEETNESEAMSSIQLIQEQEKVRLLVMNRITELHNQEAIKEYIKIRKNVYNLLVDIEKTLKKSVNKFKGEQANEQ